jgi:hypothetical protein
MKWAIHVVRMQMMIKPEEKNTWDTKVWMGGQYENGF